MGLSKSQATIWQRARALGSGGQAVLLDDDVCNFLIATIAYDLDLASKFPEFGDAPPPFFSKCDLSRLIVTGYDSKSLFERLVNADEDADTYFACLAALHKARLKYEKILSTQPMPTLEQIGPLGLLQYGRLGGRTLAGLICWRKWLFDIDNRAGQETGYLFEPIIAHAIGGTPAPASKSPVTRHKDRSKGRQVDCVLDKNAYELKIRVTMAASGQGRWQEELDFPVDCRASGYTPVLVCMDGTSSPKLDALIAAFQENRGQVHVGDKAWEHLDKVAGPSMARFLEKYVKSPLQDILDQSDEVLPDLSARYSSDRIDIQVGDEILSITRHGVGIGDANPHEFPADKMPEDIVGDLGD